MGGGMKDRRAGFLGWVLSQLASATQAMAAARPLANVVTFVIDT
jgi:hypothetical protein